MKPTLDGKNSTCPKWMDLDDLEGPEPTLDRLQNNPNLTDLRSLTLSDGLGLKETPKPNLKQQRNDPIKMLRWAQ